MKKTPKFIITGLTLLALATLNSQLSTAFAQGSLTPPGPPAPTMKSLDQIEPRTIVNAANTPGDSGNLSIISQPGSYYLTTNLVGVSGKNGIKIAANNVTLDLNGFAVQGVSGSYSGIDIPGTQVNITVRNGAISGWEDGSDVYSESGSSLNVVFERLNVSDSGGDGIAVTGAAVVRDCTCENNTYDGIWCYGGGIISGCTVNNNGQDGIEEQYCTVSGCFAKYNDFTGISAGGGTVSGCSVQNNNNDGIDVYSGTVSGCYVQNNYPGGIGVISGGTVSSCYVANNYGPGIGVAGSSSMVIGNTCIGNNTSDSSVWAGIYIWGNGSNNRIEDNHVSASGYAGISTSGAGPNNIIIKNSVSGNGAGNNYIIPGNQIVGPIIYSTGFITNSNPWANFSF
jgi:parallel beta-helix repeat protein